MLIQNVNHQAQTLQPDRMASGKLAGNGGVDAVNNAAHAESKPSPTQLRSAVHAANRAMQQASLNLQFVLDPETHKPIIKMMDAETGDVIRQIPSEEMLAISRSIDQFQQGLLLRQKA